MWQIPAWLHSCRMQWKGHGNKIETLLDELRTLCGLILPPPLLGPLRSGEGQTVGAPYGPQPDCQFASNEVTSISTCARNLRGRPSRACASSERRTIDRRAAEIVEILMVDLWHAASERMA